MGTRSGRVHGQTASMAFPVAKAVYKEASPFAVPQEPCQKRRDQTARGVVEGKTWKAPEETKYDADDHGQALCRWHCGKFQDARVRAAAGTENEAR
jgi:hypothetical protein